jgi:hypothetical protein
MSNSEVATTIALSALAQILQGFFALAKQSGATPEQVKKMFQEKSAEFEQKTPDKLPG